MLGSSSPQDIRVLGEIHGDRYSNPDDGCICSCSEFTRHRHGHFRHELKRHVGREFSNFLTLLTTQLKNQNPLNPLNTNQFTQQLVQFAGVEQQLKSNDQLASPVTLQSTAQATQAFNLVGVTAVVDGSTASLKNGAAAWALGVTKPSTVSITINNPAGQAVFFKDFTLNAGQNQIFSWNGKGNDGTQWPDGNYTISAAAMMRQDKRLLFRRG